MTDSNFLRDNRRLLIIMQTLSASGKSSEQRSNKLQTDKYEATWTRTGSAGSHLNCCIEGFLSNSWIRDLEESETVVIVRGVTEFQLPLVPKESQHG